MKVRHVIVAAAAFGGLFAVTGCQNEVGGNRADIPAPMTNPVPVTNPVTIPVTDRNVMVTPNEPVSPNVPNEPVSVIPPFSLKSESPVSYSVKKGDSLWTIAHAHGVSVGELIAVNNLSGKAVLRPGQDITIPPGGAYLPPEKRPKIKPQPRVVSHTKTVKSGTKSVASTAKSGVSAAGGTYTVASGDFPERIARKHGVSTAALLAANSLTEKSVLQIGQKLTIPGKAAIAADPVKTANAGTKTTEPAPVGVADTAKPTEGTVTAPVPMPPPVPAPGGASIGETFPANAGETLRSISVDFFIPLEELKKLNPGIAEDQPLTQGTLIKTPKI